MSEMIERVAKALWLAEVEQSAAARERPFDRVAREEEWKRDVTDPENGFYWPIYANMLARARDAIEAMREPTEAMLCAGDDVLAGDGDRSRWLTMIDEALK